MSAGREVAQSAVRKLLRDVREDLTSMIVQYESAYSSTDDCLGEAIRLKESVDQIVRLEGILNQTVTSPCGDAVVLASIRLMDATFSAADLEDALVSLEKALA